MNATLRSNWNVLMFVVDDIVLLLVVGDRLVEPSLFMIGNTKDDDVEDDSVDDCCVDVDPIVVNGEEATESIML